MSDQIFLSKEGLAIDAIGSTSGRKVLQVRKQKPGEAYQGAICFLDKDEAVLLIAAIGDWLGLYNHWKYPFPDATGHVFWETTNNPEICRLCGSHKGNHPTMKGPIV